jgi:hypothetical protein
VYSETSFVSLSLKRFEVEGEDCHDVRNRMLVSLRGVGGELDNLKT